MGAIAGRGYVVGGVDLPYDPYSGHELTGVESISYSGCGTGTPTPPTFTPARTLTPTPTSGTPLPTTPSPSASPTLCSITFIDVQPTDYFYEAVRYLYCRGVISGYGDHTFRPYNLTTRGQLTKIVVLAEGWAVYTPPTPTFSDVPQDHPFYQYVETAYHQHIISGYGDCTFRPGNNVTRGQLCKITVLAEGWEPYQPAAPEPARC